MDCAAHPGTAGEASCARCSRALCDACAAYDVDGAACCEACGRDAEERSHAIGSSLVALVGVGYLATLALGVLVFHAKPFVGGLAAIVAIALGRALQVFLKPATVVRRFARRA